MLLASPDPNVDVVEPPNPEDVPHDEVPGVVVDELAPNPPAGVVLGVAPNPVEAEDDPNGVLAPNPAAADDGCIVGTGV